MIFAYRDCCYAQAGCAAAAMCGKGVAVCGLGYIGSKCDQRVNMQNDIAICCSLVSLGTDGAELILLVSFMRKNYHFC